MRYLPIVVFAAVLGSSVAVDAAEIVSASRIDSIVVFPTGAEITRVAKVTIPAGEHAVIFNHLPAVAVPGSIRVEGRAAGSLEIGSVDTRRLLVPHADPVAQASERRRLESEIEKLRDQAQGIDADIKAADAQKALIAKLTELPANPHPPGPQGAAYGPDWGQLFQLVGSKLAEAERAQIAARLRHRDVERQIKDLEKALAALAPGQLQRTEVKVFVSAGRETDADLQIRYQVSHAAWQPYYDARLATGTKTEAPKLSLVRRASIQQRTGEDWSDVEISLSTTRPGMGTAAPELRSTTVDFEPDAPPPRPAAPAYGQIRSLGRLKEKNEADGNEARDALVVAAPAPLRQPASERAATVDVAAFQAIFKVPGRLTVPGNGEQKRVQLDAADFAPALLVRTTPRLEAKAYLYARMTMPNATPYLPGQVSLFRDGTFVGNGRLPQLTPGESHELGFGPDDAVRVKHALVEEKRGETGIISTSKTDSRSWRLSVRNGHAQAIQVSLTDQVPVSQNQDIKVEMVAKVPPSQRDVEDRRGVLAWDFKVEPNEERVIDFGYRVTWPAGKRIQYGGH